MVVVASIKRGYVDGHFAVVCKCDEKLFQHFGFKFPDIFSRQWNVVNQIRPSADVNTDTAKGLIHRGKLESVAGDTGFIAKGFGKSLAEKNADILQHMVVIGSIACCFQGQIKAAVLGEQGHHVIKKANTGGDVALAVAVKVQAQLNVGFKGFSCQCDFSFHLIIPFSIFQVLSGFPQGCQWTAGYWQASLRFL